MSPNVEVIEQWAERLESGDYKQGRGYLNLPRVSGGPYSNADDRLYCCLGVLTEMAVEAGVLPAGTVQPAYGGALVYGEHDLGCALSPEVQRWVGLSGDPLVGVANGAANTTLAKLNDTGVKFPEIAAIIRDNFLPVEVAA